jgi:hypothetical protein
MADLRAAGDTGYQVSQQRVFGDLISYQNDRKCSTAIVSKVEKA